MMRQINARGSLTMTTRWHASIALLTAVGISIWAAGTAQALELMVDTPADSIIDTPAVSFTRCVPAVAGDCSLRGALLRANAVPGPHTIVLPANTYTQTIVGNG